MAVESSKNSINSKQEIMERFAELSVKMTEVMKLSREIDQYMEMEQELPVQCQSDLGLACSSPNGRFSPEFKHVSEQIDKMNGQKIDIPFEQYDRYCSSTDIMMNIIYNLLRSRQIS
jgi:hypothetical protein